MNVLIDELPEDIDGVAINPSFRVWIMFEQLIRDDTIRPRDKIVQLCRLIYKDPTEGIQAISASFEHILDFYSCGQRKAQEGAHGKAEIAFDFEQDQHLILAGFQQAYGIDLTSNDLHWWRFMALFQGLPDECRITKIMGYRTMDTSGLPKKTKEQYEHLKRLYKINRAPIYQSKLDHDTAIRAKVDALFKRAEAWKNRSK